MPVEKYELQNYFSSAYRKRVCELFHGVDRESTATITLATLLFLAVCAKFICITQSTLLLHATHIHNIYMFDWTIAKVRMLPQKSTRNWINMVTSAGHHTHIHTFQGK